MQRDEEYLLDILEAGKLAIAYVGKMTVENILSNR